MSNSGELERFAAERAALVRDIRETGIRDGAVLRAFAEVPRHLFVPESQRHFAYRDRALPLVEGQTISQPSMIAIMLQELSIEPDDDVLEVGAGCGYAAAIASRIARRVDAVEIRPALVALARRNLSTGEYPNVTIHQGDGRAGLPEHAPYDVIVVSAGAAAVPPALLDQLTEGGRIGIPVGTPGAQVLELGTRRGAEIRWRHGVRCVFVPLVGGDAT